MAYHNPNNPDALPCGCAVLRSSSKRGFAAYRREVLPGSRKKGGDKVNTNQQPPPQQQNYRPQPQPQYHQPQQPQYHQPQQQQQQQQQAPPRRQPEPSYRQDARPHSPMGPPRDGYNSGGGGGGPGRVGLPSGPRAGANMQPPPRSPVPPARISPAPQSPQSRVMFQGDEELTTDQLRTIFEGLDTHRVGYITEKQLAENLVNSDRTKFDTYTVNMMVRMFDSDRSGDLNFQEFVGLWQFLDRWRTIFNRFDTDRSGNISMDEFKNTLVSFQYRLSDGFIEFLFKNYDRENRGVITFDLFMQSCITLKRMTDTFKKYDDDRDGYITINFEDFVSEFLRQMRRVMIVDDGKNQPPPGAY
ncbi:calcium-binding protein modulator protein [Sporothrix brasiliensis 5110]|uniref:Calcium-binding protein modulator protein n=1 Tax=Sporothrix brasiliensis 5110 TaxID=1398154 RepID=A0A0C2FEY6_9PEZI|nr:calcium-binding protein modulator protein [Sporothrix brasiliensis 5110]KIH89648.1 calcium-binding protein modulator protein [Sporothrix brasiliensis 5110]